ncbi:hypothetical protein TanjilG_05325 [Lupinus angustifolius]|uniref:Germin-like protein n=1 Tax=Lupinus angustifolius TaxID=3871 RepID=A0A1J7IKZ1_LUPAN|nr:hypothetical protein TanjilG_05325 [Lupinus angustifolius]
MKVLGSLLLVTVAMVLAITTASDPDPLQDFCVANLTSVVEVNGFTCKNASEVNASDFSSLILAKPGSTNNTYGSLVTRANVLKVAGLNTLGGLNPPHTHPRATEVVFVLKGTLDVGFITVANVLISKTITKGEIFVFPKGLVHFQKNNGHHPASVIASFNSQYPGKQSIALTLFTATPPLPNNVLSKAFQVSTNEVEIIKSNLAPKN